MSIARSTGILGYWDIHGIHSIGWALFYILLLVLEYQVFVLKVGGVVWNNNPQPGAVEEI